MSDPATPLGNAIATQARQRAVIEVRLAATKLGVDRRVRCSRLASVGIGYGERSALVLTIAASSDREANEKYER